MRSIGIVFIQIVIAVLVAGLVMPAVLFSVPATRHAGPLVLLILGALLFALLRLAWPQPKGTVHSDDGPRD